MATANLPDSHRDLLERPLFAHLTTVRDVTCPKSRWLGMSWPH
jgi:hypothetical protein